MGIKTLTALLVVALFSGFAMPASAQSNDELESAVESSSVDVKNLKDVPSITFDSTKTEPQNIQPSVSPDAPANMYLIHSTATDMTLLWDEPVNNGGETITGYRLGVSTNNINFQYFSLTSTSVFLYNMTENTTYYFTVQAQNASGYSPVLSGRVTTPMSNSAPTAPLQLAKESIGDTTAGISWYTPLYSGTLLTEYIVAYSTDNVTWSEATFTSSGSYFEQKTLTGLKQGTTYYVKVVAVNSNGRGAWSETITFNTTGVKQAAPAQPTSLASTFSNQHAVTLSWSPPTDNGGSAITDYVIQYKSKTATTWNTWNDGVSVTPSTTVTGLWGGTTYNFRVASVNSVGVGAYTTYIESTTKPKTVPGVPIKLQLVDGYKTSFTIRWSPPVNNGGAGIKDYIIQYKLNTSSTWTTLNDGVSTATSVTIRNLTNWKTYNFRIAAVNSIGAGAYSNSYVNMTPPAAPTNYSITSKTHNTVTLQYNHVANTYKPPVRDAIIQYRQQGSSTWKTYNDGVSLTTNTTITGLTPNTPYEFRVASMNNSGWSAFTQASTTSTNPSVEATPPTNLLSTMHNTNSVLLEWSPATSTDITDYTVQYSTDGQTWATYPDGESTSTSAYVKGLNPNVAYQFRVATVASNTTSIYSTPISVTTSNGLNYPQAPNVTIHGITSTTASLSWVQEENTDSRVTGFTLFISTDGGNTFEAYNLGQNVGRVNITGMTPSTSYMFILEAVNSNGTGYSATGQINTT